LLVGVALAAAVVAGSLIIGDSVKASLKQMGENRLGGIAQVLVGGDRFFSETLSRAVPGGTPAILVQGTVSAGGGKARANRVQVLAVTSDFGPDLGTKGDPNSFPVSTKGDLGINAALASRLGAEIGDTLLVRVEIPGALSKDAPLSGPTDNDLTIRRKVTHLVTADQLGGFKLGADQLPALNVFLPLGDLQDLLDQQGRCNLALTTNTDAETVTAAITNSWTLDDLALEIVPNAATDSGLGSRIQSDRVFLDPAVADAAVAEVDGATPVVTYLVNAISSESAPSGATPNSMVTAVDGIVPPATGGSTSPPPAAITQWLADDQELKIGSSLTMKFFALGETRELVERSAEFVVSRILPMDDPVVNRTWTPEFPGVSEVDNCRDWDPGFEVDLDAIRGQDEEYWDTYRGTPKVFISLAEGRRLWGNRFGDLTSIRLATSLEPAALTEQLRVAGVGPSTVGIETIDVGSGAGAAIADSLPLGDYFLYFSWFILCSALIFAALLFLFTVESRASQLGLQMAIGLPRKVVRRGLLGEALVVAVIGSIVGIVLGILYAKACLWGLANIWSGAVGAIPFVFHFAPGRAIAAAIGTVVLAWVVVWFSSRKILLTEPRELLAGGWENKANSASEMGLIRRTLPLWLGLLALIGAGVALWAATTLDLPAEGVMGAFFGAGSLLLTAGLCGLALGLRRLQSGSAQVANLGGVGRRNTLRRRGRSLALAAIVGSAVFLVAAVNAFRLDASDGAEKRSSGTGGYALYGESSLPIYDDLNSPAGRQAFGFDPEELDGIGVVAIRTRDGEDASCLNLNRAQRPTLLGIDPAALADRQSFTFASTFVDLEPESSGWNLLNSSKPDQPIPGIVDRNTVTYGLGKKLGDTITFTDGSGEPFEVQIVGLLANSVLQGRVIISEQSFLDKYPESGGANTFLIDVDGGSEKRDEISGLLSRQLSARGLSLQPAVDRLAEFHGVQNSYLSIFTALGGLGVLIGTAGLAAVVARHIRERRGELGLMRAIGFSRSNLLKMVLSENAFLLIAGVVIGLVSAAVAVWPLLSGAGSGSAIGWMLVFGAGILATGLISTSIGARLCLRDRESLTDALRSE